MANCDGSGIPAYVDEENCAKILFWLIERTGASSIIDLGTGLGWIVRAAEERGLYCVGVEGNEDFAKKKECGSDLLVADVTSPDFNPGRFDLATSFECIEHIPMELQQDFFAGAARVSDRMICSISIVGPPNEFHVTIEDEAWWKAWLSERGVTVQQIHDFPSPKFNVHSIVLDLGMTGYKALP